MDTKKLLINERVEIRLLEEGLRGSWHPAVVIGISNLSRTVKYDELLNEKGNYRLIESVPVTEAIEGLHRRRHVSSTYRGHIRPLSPFSKPRPTDKLAFGVRVDAFFKDAWWEGVIFDAEEDAMERSVYFPDEGDEVKFSLDDLRLSHVWDEFSGEWTDCGVWVFLELVRELDGSMPSSRYVKKLWRSLQSNYGFKKMISEWNCGTRSLWEKYLKDVLCKRGSQLVMKDLARKKLTVCKAGKKRLKLVDPPQVEVDLPSPSTVLQLRSSKGLTPVELSENGVSIFNKSRTRMVSVPLRLNVRKPNRPVVPSAGDNVVLSETLSTEEIVTSYASVQNDANSEEEYSKTSPTSCSLSNHGVNRVPIPIGKEQLGMVKHREEKPQLPKSCQDGNKLKGHQLREDNVATGASCCAEMNQCVLRATVKKLKQKRRNYSVLSSEYTQKESSSEASVAVGAKRKTLCTRTRSQHAPVGAKTKTSCTRKKNQQGVCRPDANIESPLTQEDGNGGQVKQNSFSRQRRQTPLFEDCERNFRLKDTVSHPRKRKRKRQLNGPQSDTICLVCHYGGELIPCNNCSSSYHLTCLGTQVVPNGKWFCKSCCCGLCGSSSSINDNEEWTKICFQCSRRYHVQCLNKLGQGVPYCLAEGFCSDSCYQLSVHLHRLLGTSNPTSVDGLTWTMIRSMRNDHRTCGFARKTNLVKLSHALRVIKESFQPITELHTKRDLVKDVVYSSVSKLKRLNFQGFYVMVLRKGDDVVSAATIRIHGQKIAEMPLVATNFDYRHQGMCRLLVHELIKLLQQMGIERFVLPSASQLKTMWETSFGFSEMPLFHRLELLGYPLLGFQGTTMIQKFLDSTSRNVRRDPVFTSEDTQRSKSIVSVMPSGQPPTSERFWGVSYMRKLNRGSSVEQTKAEVYKKRCKHEIVRERFGEKNEAQCHAEIIRPFQYLY